jgi:Cu/Ag efflux protein CusF
MTPREMMPAELKISRMARLILTHFALVTISTLPASAQILTGSAGTGTLKQSSPTGNAAAAANVNSITAAGGISSVETGIDPTTAAREQKLLAYFAANQVKKNAADADKLLLLTRTLNVTVTAPAATVSSAASKQADLAVLKQLDQIEKLAKRVRERMASPVTIPSLDPLHRSNLTQP